MTSTATARRFAAPSAACLFVGLLPDGGNVFIDASDVIMVVDSDEPGDYSAFPLDVCIDMLPAASRSHQAALLYLEQGSTPPESVSEVTPASNRSEEMTETITVRKVTVVEYIEITRTAPAAPAAPVIDVTPAPAALPAAPAFRIGDRVRYTSKAGRTATYSVKWVGESRQTAGGQRLGLRCPGKRDLFFVEAGACSPA